MSEIAELPVTAPARRTWFDRWQHRPLDVPMQLWRAARRTTVAAVFALFPFVFMIDESVTLGFSPVLPSLVALALLIVALPFVLVATWRRMHRRRDAPTRTRKAVRLDQVARFARAAAIVWFLVWLALGA